MTKYDYEYDYVVSSSFYKGPDSRERSFCL